MIRGPYVYRRVDKKGPFAQLRPGEIIDYEEPLECFKFLELREVPDPAHQSSLDYLNGV